MSTRLPKTMTFSDEQSMLLDTALDFCKKASPIEAARNLLLDDAGYSASVWQEMIALGWTGIAIPEEYGGSGLGLAAVVPVVEPMGRHLLATPFVASQIAIQGVLAAGSDDQKSHWLPVLAQGTAATAALTEEDGNWGLQEITSTLQDGMLTGSKSLVLDALCAELVVVSVNYEGSVALALVPRTAIAAERFTRDIVLDETRRSFTVDLEGVGVQPDQLITGEAALRGLQAMEQCAWLLYSAEACGGIHATIDLVVEYLNTRTQFGRKIGSYQALKHPTVDMLTGLERSRSHVYHAASMFAAQGEAVGTGEELNIALRMAKADSGEAFNFAADRAIQFHGGFGFTYECDAQLFLRRALWLQYQFGDAPHHRAELQGLLLDGETN